MARKEEHMDQQNRQFQTILTIIKVVFILLIFMIFSYLMKITVCTTDQMMPAITFGDVCIYENVLPVTVNDIVCYDNGNKCAIGRVIYTPRQERNETAAIIESTYINDQLKDELASHPDAFLILNDNQDSVEPDSQDIGLIERTAIKGRLIVQIRTRDF